MKTKATDNIWYCADRSQCLGLFFGATPSYPGDNGWHTVGISSHPDPFADNRCAGTVKCWQLTMGRLPRCGDIYAYERTRDSGHSQVKRGDITCANYSFQRSQQSKGDEKIHLGIKKVLGAERSFSGQGDS
ncbi:unnamed protein product [Calypogeia fissa]